MKEAIVTGADGFIGRHLCHELSQQGWHITALVMPGSPTVGRIESISNLSVVFCDLCDLTEAESRLPCNPEMIFHLAWMGVAPETRNSLETQQKNIAISLNIVRLAARLHAAGLILPGSTMEYMYGEGAINGYNIPTPQNLYGAVKVAVRYMCEALARDLKVPLLYTIITSVYGADRLDNNVITYVINQLLSAKKPSLTRLEQKWDYIHIDDLIRAMVLLAEKGNPGETYVIGHGDNIPLAEYILQIRDIIDHNLPLGIGEIPYISNQLPRSCVDISQLQKDTGFVPEIPFKKGIREVIEFIKHQKGGI